MQDEKDLVTDVTENVETTTEQTQGQVTETVKEPEKLYSEEDLNNKINELLPKKMARIEKKVRKEYEGKYGNVENVLKSGLGVQTLEEATSQLTDFYTRKGIQIPTTPTYSDDDLKILGRAEADEIISSGFDEVVEEVDRLANIGVANMTPRETEVFKRLAEYRQNEEARLELAKIGVGDKVLQDTAFMEFSAKLNPTLSIKEKYEMYTKFNPKAKVETMGSMKNTTKDNGVKEFYTREEALQFTKADFDKNPALFKAVENSMYKW
jgi:hypothetical protein